jgi:mRNA interferase MazF
MNKTVLRGEIYVVDFDPVRGSEQGGTRPALVVQNDVGNRHSPTLIVAPITSRQKPALPVHLPISGIAALKHGSAVLLEQVRVIDRSRLGRRLGSVGYVAMRLVDAALAVSLGLKRWCGHDGGCPPLADAPLPLPKEPAAVARPGGPTVRTLCQRCKHDYEDAGFGLRLISRLNDAKHTCDRCNHRQGFDYEVVEVGQ